MSRKGWAALPATIAILGACGGGSTVGAAPNPQDLQAKMQIVQQQFQSEQQVLDKNKDSILNIVSGGGVATAPANFFDFLHDPTILLGEIGDSAEAASLDDLLAGWQAHADAWCALGSADFDSDFFEVYGGAHVLPALVAFLDTYCGKDEAAALVAAADAQDLGEGMASSGDPTAGIDLDDLLTSLNG